MLKFYFAPPLTNSVPDNGAWNAFKIFDKQHIVYGLLIGLLVGGLLAAGWMLAFERSLPFGSPSWTDIIIAVLIISVGHELVHLLGFPGAGFNGNARLGVWPQTGSAYVQYTSPMSRNRLLFATILPFIVISIVPFILCSKDLMPIEYWSWIAVLNAVGAGSDLLLFVKLLLIVPSDSCVLESGEELYWSTAGQGAEQLSPN